jgi:hypothetical protein
MQRRNIPKLSVKKRLYFWLFEDCFLNYVIQKTMQFSGRTDYVNTNSGLYIRCKRALPIVQQCEDVHVFDLHEEKDHRQLGASLRVRRKMIQYTAIQIMESRWKCRELRQRSLLWFIVFV